MRVEAPAKVNLFLTVGARRSDGLHELVSVMQAVSLADEVTLDDAAEWSVRVEPPGAAPEDEANLVVRAGRALADAQGVGRAAQVRITKRIPVAAGLAGGSADAAAVLVGLNRLWDARASRKAIEKVAASVGADVSFCVRGGTAAVYGAGESISSLPCPRPVWWVIGVPARSLSTAEVYASYDRLGGGALGDPYEVADALARGDPGRLGAALRNDLEPAASALDPSVGDGRAALLSAGALAAAMTGSGPAWIGLARDEEHARAVAAACAGAFARVEVARSVDHGARVVER